VSDYQFEPLGNLTPDERLYVLGMSRAFTMVVEALEVRDTGDPGVRAQKKLTRIEKMMETHYTSGKIGVHPSDAVQFRNLQLERKGANHE
jgi:hypothetical protein